MYANSVIATSTTAIVCQKKAFVKSCRFGGYPFDWRLSDTGR